MPVAPMGRKSRRAGADRTVDGTEIGPVDGAPETTDPQSADMGISWGLAEILFLIAIICFVLAALGFDLRVGLVALGLAFGFGGFLVGNRGFRVP